MILNATTSYDPDDSASVLSYTWECPPEINKAYSCSDLSYGSAYNSLLKLDALQRVKLGLSYSRAYTFKLTVKSEDNSYKST
jgi:hypothetical protein